MTLSIPSESRKSSTDLPRFNSPRYSNEKGGKLSKLPPFFLQLFRRRLLQRRTAANSGNWERRSRAVQRVANHARLVAAEPALPGGADNARDRGNRVRVP